MKRNLCVLLFVLFGLPIMVHAGGLMTNTNQSASYIRMPVLDAIVGPEGVYYNPAGLAFLSDGLHISVSNQSILQKRTINSNFPGMNRSEFEGTVSAPLFPSAYLTYKKDRLAFSLGVNPIGGGGSALFEDGLPSFEQQVAVLPPSLSNAGIITSQYDFETEFDAQSIFWGLQANASYALNNMISVSAGLRYVTATNTYKGYMRDITINPNFPILGLTGTTMTRATSFFGNMANLFGQLAGVSGQLQQVVNAGYGHLTLSQAMQAGVPGFDATSVAMITGGFQMIDPTVNVSALNIATIQAYYQGATPAFQAQQIGMQQSQALTSDKEVDVKQTGSSFAPIFGIHLQLSDRINLAAKYEHRTPLKVKNSTTTDDLGLYPDNQETANNLPSMLSVGGSFGITSKLTLSTGIHYYFDKTADYGKSRPNDEIIDNNFWEAGLGFEYDINRFFLVSAGYLRTQTGVNELYHSDQSHSLSTNTLGTGVRVQFTNLLALNVGVLYSQYVPHTKDFSTSSTPTINYREEYDRNNMVFAVGIDLKL
jgi:long-chain fatty acid transport protein